MTLPASAQGRLRLLLALLAWLVPRREATIEELADRFALDAGDVVALVELASCCGVPPYTPDALLDLYVDGEKVQANLGSMMSRPRRLSASEGFALAASARAILSVPGSDPEGRLNQALAKLEVALGGRSGVSVEIDDPPFLVPIRSALEVREQIEIDYYSASRDEVTTRLIEPLVLFAVDGRLYVDAFCHRASGVRHFRLDRVRAARRTGLPFSDAIADLPESSVESQNPQSAFFDESPEVVIDLPTASRWAIETLPTRSVSPTGKDKIRVVLPVTGIPWLERLLLIVGPEAQVVSPEDWVGVGRDAARRMRELYEPITDATS